MRQNNLLNAYINGLEDKRKGMRISFVHNSGQGNEGMLE
jgi:hypothetical protein